MHHHRPLGGLIRAIGVLAWLGARGANARPGATMARHQLFFVGVEAGQVQPTLLALVVQRTRTPAGVSLEAKAFLAWRGAWQPPFWEQLSLPEPSTVPLQASLDSAVRAWRGARGDRRLRIRWSARGALDGFELGIRRPGGGIRLLARGLHDAGGGRDPHGSVRWRVGRGSLRVNGVDVQGRVVVERLEGADPWPRYGRFEMWLLGTSSGTLLLGRRHLDRAGPGEALRVPQRGRAEVVPFQVIPIERRADPASGYRLPTRWQITLPLRAQLDRRGGQVARGQAPGGEPAAYDIAAARGRGVAALVFHLQDRP